MLQLHKLQWGNCFSYAEPNEIVLDEARITQLVGKNGHGKSSIALILEEVLFNKNNKSIKKAHIPNRNIGTSYWIKLSFSSGDSEFLIDLERKSSLKIKLFKDGVDISSHTGTATFNTIKDILGVDFKVFSQLFYQSSTVGLMFLTATDTNRKKFLIDLFTLDDYLKYHELYKALHKEVNTELESTKGSFSTVQKWLESNEDPGDIRPLQHVEAPDNSELAKAVTELDNIKSTNKKISDNNKLKEIIADIDYDKELVSLDPINISEAQKEQGKLEVQISNKAARIDSLKRQIVEVDTELLQISTVDLSEFQAEINQLNNDIAIGKAEEAKLLNVDNICPTCTQEVTEDFKARKIADARQLWQQAEDQKVIVNQDLTKYKNNNDKIFEANKNHVANKVVKSDIDKLELEIETLSDKHAEVTKFITDNMIKANEIAKAKEKHREWENIYVRIDRELPFDLLLAEELEASIKVLKTQYKEAKDYYEEVQKSNNLASAHNARVKVYNENSTKYQEELTVLQHKIEEFSERASALDTLKKAFSTNGLVAYKLENLVKDLQIMANEYLAELSDGRFVLEFELEKDKLNIVIIDNGNFIGISALSAGELARVNAATLLAIRKLMNSISKTQINILFLDEIINVLDDDGKEKLIEVLLEENLNTFLVSHGWSHPMLNKIHVVKEDDISRLETE